MRGAVAMLERPPVAVRPWGVPALDAALPEGGLALGRLHEVVAHGNGAGEGEAGTGFAALMLARIAGASGRVLWCGPGSATSALYGPGLAAFGLDPDRVILARSAAGDETLWAMEEGLRCKALAAVAGDVAALDLIAGRRLQLAAERGGVTAVVLRRQRRAQARLDPSAATTRWRVSPLPGTDDYARWNVELLRCRGGVPRDFRMDWCHATGDLAVAAAPGDRPGASGSDAAAQQDAAD